eukprot:jgi/Ulvmu1/9266/UM050_0015.1
MLLPLVSSTLSEAFSLLPRVQELQPPAGHPATRPLGPCIQHLPLCVNSAQELLPALVACCSAGYRASGRTPNSSLPSYSFLVASAVASLHRCGRANLSQALAPFGADMDNSVRTLLSMAADDTAQAGILCVLDRLAVVAPQATLEVSGSTGTPAYPTPWSLRWCILSGSLCDLANNRSSRGAAFWNGLLRVVAQPLIHEFVDMWGDSRAPDIDAIHRDTKGELWGQWLAAALLSGMLQQEQMACPQLLIDALSLKCGAAQATQQVTFAAAVNMVNCPAAVDVALGCRAAICAVITVSVHSIACSQVCHQRFMTCKQSLSDFWPVRHRGQTSAGLSILGRGPVNVCCCTVRVGQTRNVSCCRLLGTIKACSSHMLLLSARCYSCGLLLRFSTFNCCLLPLPHRIPPAHMAVPQHLQEH